MGFAPRDYIVLLAILFIETATVDRKRTCELVRTRTTRRPALTTMTKTLLETLVSCVDCGTRRIETATRRRRLRFARSPEPLNGPQSIADLPASPTFLFLCLGNICRSPMAERYLERRAAEAGLTDLSIESAGLVDHGGRPSPETAVEVAREYGIDLTDHRSTVVDEDLLAESDAVFVMDVSNVTRLRRRHGTREGVYCLGAFGNTREFEISDPYGGDRASFRRVYGEVATAVDSLVSTYRVFRSRDTSAADGSVARTRECIEGSGR